jgi:hypothetical protein
MCIVAISGASSIPTTETTDKNDGLDVLDDRQ